MYNIFMNSSEINTKQLGLKGFGHETPAQLETKQKEEKREKRTVGIPINTIVYEAGLPDKIYVVTEFFDVLRAKKTTSARGLETVTVESSEAHVRSEQDLQWGDGKSIWSKGKVIVVPLNRMITKKK
jgi:hypothetical protein